MSQLRTREWLLAQKQGGESVPYQNGPVSGHRKAKTICFASGKGGVGKTSLALKSSRLLADWGFKVLLVDCDYNLSNSVLKLGVPLNNDFYSLVTAQKNFEDCLHKEGNFHLLSGCNGNLELFENGLELDKVVIDIIASHENDYDYIVLDCAAGLSKESLNLNAYCDHRFVVVTPDKSSITDSYSLMKILNNRYGVRENHLLLNKISTRGQYNRLVRTMSDTVENFLKNRLKILGYVSYETSTVDQFDRLLLKDAGSRIHNNIFKLLKRFTEENISAAVSLGESAPIPVRGMGKHEQDVHSTIS